jgi:hypothetical protein
MVQSGGERSRQQANGQRCLVQLSAKTLGGGDLPTMTLQELGGLGEFIAAVAVVISLAYLAVQIRRNTGAVRSATEQGQVDAHTRYLGFLVQDPELIRLLQRGASGEPLDKNESLRLGFFFDVLFAQTQAGYFHYREGTISSEQWQTLHRIAARWLLLAAVQAWWAREKGIFRDDFIQYIDTMILRSE